MTDPGAFLTGVIEGYYGRTWPFETRLAYAAYLARAGLNTCIYCPKSDPYLRKRWRDSWPDPQWQRLVELAGVYRSRGIYWGVGLSPFALYREYGTRQRAALREKVLQLAELRAPLLAILFDDMPGDCEALAQRQADIVCDVCDWMGETRILVCPTYYSFDPVLEKHFGRMPADYWPELGRALPPDVDIFWTGNRVCSATISVDDILPINSSLGRRVMLWDNYPVNDGAVRSNFLYCESLSGRDPALRDHLAGHLCNPMNQGLLSLPALAGLAALYGLAGSNPEWLPEVLGASLWQQLCTDRATFQYAGRSGMGEPRCQALARVYDAIPGRAAEEIAGWLRGEYAFDPACLTD